MAFQANDIVYPFEIRAIIWEDRPRLGSHCFNSTQLRLVYSVDKTTGHGHERDQGTDRDRMLLNCLEHGDESGPNGCFEATG